MFLLLAFLAVSILLRKTFCSWLCPVGKMGKRFRGSNFTLPRWPDLALRAPKYALLAAFGYVVVAMSADAIAAFLGSPYGLIADVKMLDLFRRMGETTAVVLSIVVVLSLFIKTFWCRFLCPYGALMGLGSLFSPVWVKRNPEACIDCAKCRKACPSNLPVDTNLAIHSAECIGCLECVSACPSENALDFSIMGRRALGNRATDPRWLAAGIFVIFFGFVVYAKLSGHWESPIPEAAYRQLIQRSAEYAHPH
jgi:polyferredoxin